MEYGQARRGWARPSKSTAWNTARPSGAGLVEAGLEQGMEYGRAVLGVARLGPSEARNMGGHIRKNNKPTQQHGQRITTL
jgi:hypothetical protein